MNNKEIPIFLPLFVMGVLAGFLPGYTPVQQLVLFILVLFSWDNNQHQFPAAFRHNTNTDLLLKKLFHS